MRLLADRLNGRLPIGPDRGEHRSVVVIGGGISGLVAAYELRRRGVNVTLYEASRQTGGSLRTTSCDGFLAEHGAHAVALTRSVEQLITRIGLREDVVEAAPQAAQSYVLRGTTLFPQPDTLRALFTSGLLSLRARLRLLCEPLIPREEAEFDESVASFIGRRCGQEVLDYVVDPAIQLETGGDSTALSMAQLFPAAHRLEREHGSLGRALLASHSSVWTRGNLGSSTLDNIQDESRPRMISFRTGMQALPHALEQALSGTVQLNCPARLLHRQDSRWVVDTGPEGDSKPQVVDAVVLATPAHVLAAMELPAEIRRYAAPIEHVEHLPISTITLGFRASDVQGPLDAGTVLVPRAAGRSVAGVLVNSSIFAGRAPAGHVSFTCIAGGGGAPAAMHSDTELLVDRALCDLRALFGIRGDPVFRKHVYWPRGVPQYTVGFAEVTRAADATELLHPGLYLAGNYRGGSRVADCVEGGQQVAQRVATYLARAG